MCVCMSTVYVPTLCISFHFMEWSPRTTILAQHNLIELGSGKRSCRQINVRAWSTREQKGSDLSWGRPGRRWDRSVAATTDDFAFLAVWLDGKLRGSFQVVSSKPHLALEPVMNGLEARHCIEEHRCFHITVGGYPVATFYSSICRSYPAYHSGSMWSAAMIRRL